MSTSQPFHVDLRGVVSLLSRHIYSGPRVYLRELIQNGVDAVAARVQETGVHGSWGIRITPPQTASEPFSISDDGIGLTLDEVSELLATVGSSSKRDFLDLPKHGYLGHFGIGMLSCFMLTDEIIVRSKSVKSSTGVIWHGLSNGTFTVDPISEAESATMPVGTTVEFIPRADDRSLTTPKAVQNLASLFAKYVSVPVDIWMGDKWVRINQEPVFALDYGSMSEDQDRALLELGKEICGAEPFGCVELRVPGTDLRGTAFLLARPIPPHQTSRHTAYLGGLLVSDHLPEIAPPWAFFVRCVITSTSITPTASREQLVQDDSLELIRDGIADCLRQRLSQMVQTDPRQMEQFVAIHHLGLWSVSIFDDDLARLVIPWLPVETNQGNLSLDAYLRISKTLRYCETDREFQSVSSLNLGGSPIINAGHTYEVPLLTKMPSLFSDVKIQKVTLAETLGTLALPPADDQRAVANFQEAAERALATLDVAAEVRVFEPIDTPAFLVTDKESWRQNEKRLTKATADPEWGEILDTLSNQSPSKSGRTRANRVCFNWAAPIVKTVAGLDDEVVVSRVLRVLYLQAALASSRPLLPREKQIANDALGDLIALSHVDFD